MRYLFLFLFLLSSVSVAKRSIVGLRDAETELFLKKIAEPIFKKAKLDSDLISIHLIADKTPNAFVTNGQNMFIHAGLFLIADHENEIAGVLAHETGHIDAGHLARLKSRIKKTQTASIIGIGLGALAILGGAESAQAGLAIMASSQTFATKNLLSYTREEERMADEIGLQLLEKTDNSAQGFLSFMKKLGEKQKLLVGKNANKYLMSHPVTEDRESYLEGKMRENSTLNKKLKTASADFQWIKAKTTGYFDGNFIESVYQKNTDYKLYAKSFFHLKEKRFKTAEKYIKILLKKYPKNPFFHETYGQILVGLGKIKTAVKTYKTALKYIYSPLIKMQFIETSLKNKNANLDDLKTELEVLKMQDSKLNYANKLLGILYGKKGEAGKKHYALAEYNFNNGNKKEAKKHIALAQKKLDKKSTEYLKLMDIKKELK